MELLISPDVSEVQVVSDPLLSNTLLEGRLYNCAYEMGRIHLINNESKLLVVQRVCHMLGVKNSFDVETPIRPNQIIPFCDEIRHNHSEWQKLFKLRVQNVDINSKSIAPYLAVVRGVIKKWSGHYLTSDNTRCRIYHLVAPVDNFPLLVATHKYQLLIDNIPESTTTLDNKKPEQAPIKKKAQRKKTAVIQRLRENQALYAICQADNPSRIKIGKVSATATSLMGQYSTRYNPQGYTLLRYWSGTDYYNIETDVHEHPLLVQKRVCNSMSGYPTEWFEIDIETIDKVVSVVIEAHRCEMVEEAEKAVKRLTLVVIGNNNESQS